jgi:molecular chaperone DnaK
MSFSNHAVGIDLGTTYSSIAYLNERGEPVSIPNSWGELSTPSAVFFDGKDVVVGTEALQHAIICPNHVILNAKRRIGDVNHFWVVEKTQYDAIDVSALILRELLQSAKKWLGTVRYAVISVPAQFSSAQREATRQAGLRAGLRKVDLISEPVASALYYIFGSEGRWFTEISNQQSILVCDLGGGTFDLSLVKYSGRLNEVRVVASGGDLALGGNDWNTVLERAVASKFASEFGFDPRDDKWESQYLAWEVENAKRSLTVRPRVLLSCQGRSREGPIRKSYEIQRDRFEKLTAALVDRVRTLISSLLRDNNIKWAHIDVVISTGGASRMPMIRDALKQLSGRTLNTSLSPELSVAHGAAHYAQMLLAGQSDSDNQVTTKVNVNFPVPEPKRSSQVTSKAIGVLVRDEFSDARVPHYLIGQKTVLPAIATEQFCTTADSQTRVHLRIIESTDPSGQSYREIGSCVIDQLVPDSAKGELIEVTFTCDENAVLRVTARELASGKQVATTLTHSVADDLGSIRKELTSSIQTERKQPHAVFISYASAELALAKRLCSALEDVGIDCWISHRDITPGMDWSPAILDAIRSARAVVLIHSMLSNNSQPIAREVHLAVDNEKPVIAFRIEHIEYSKALKFLLLPTHWLEAWEGKPESYFPRLIDAIRGLLGPERR